MYLTKNKIRNGVMCAAEVLGRADIFAENPDMLPISIDAVTDFVANKCDKKIEIREVVFEGKYLKGRKETFADGRVVIEVRSDLADFWKRFIAAKEVLHVLVDSDDDDLSPYGDEILETLVREGHIGIISGNGDKPPMQSELVAEIAAREVLYPMSRRQNDIQRLETGEVTLARLELEYELPGAVVSSVLDLKYIGWVNHACTEE